MNKSQSVSVLMPVYNCAKYLRESIESILSQSFQDFEFIIINDGSTDESPNILNDYANKDSRIKIVNQTNRGIVVALNRGLLQAKGEWIFRMDGDDVAFPHRFAVQIETLQKKPSLVLLGGWCQQINSEGSPLKVNKYPAHHNGLVRSLETHRPFFPHPTACYRRNVVLQLGGYQERLRHAEDMDLWLRLAVVGEFACCKDVVLQLRKHENTVSSLHSHLQQLRSMAARICYFRRKANDRDLSQAKDEEWKQFLEWAEKRLEEEGYFRRMESWLSLRNRWYTNASSSKLKRLIGLVKELTNNSLAREAFYSLFRKQKLALKLAEESGRIFT